jgi:hypothetical protein
MLVFVNKNRELFLSNSEIRNINTRYNQNLHSPTTSLSLVQKGVLYSGSRIYNCLPSSIKALSNEFKFLKPHLRVTLLRTPFIVWMNIIISNDYGSHLFYLFHVFISFILFYLRYILQLQLIALSMMCLYVYVLYVFVLYVF